MNFPSSHQSLTSKPIHTPENAELSRISLHLRSPSQNAALDELEDWENNELALFLSQYWSVILSSPTISTAEDLQMPINPL